MQYNRDSDLDITPIIDLGQVSADFDIGLETIITLDSKSHPKSKYLVVKPKEDTIKIYDIEMIEKSLSYINKLFCDSINLDDIYTMIKGYVNHVGNNNAKETLSTLVRFVSIFQELVF